MLITEDIAQIREDVAYIKAKVEALPDHEARLRGLERFRYAVPSVSVLALGVSAVVAGFAVFSS